MSTLWAVFEVFYRTVGIRTRPFSCLIAIAYYTGQSRIVLKPKTSQEVSAIMQYCNKRLLAVCPQGGNTGLVGGSVPVFDEVILSTQLMNNIENIDEISGSVG